VDCSLIRVAVPPMWKVRMVSCVPGSPMDCAAITPSCNNLDTRKKQISTWHRLPGGGEYAGSKIVVDTKNGKVMTNG